MITARVQRAIFRRKNGRAHDQGHAVRANRWPFWLLLSGLVMAGCGGNATGVGIPKTTLTPISNVSGSTATVGPIATAPAVTPRPGTYSVYIDPTWRYQFHYPANWIVYPQTGNQESNVIISEPYSPEPDHAMVRLLVRVTNNFQHAYVQQYLCNRTPSTTVAGYDAVDLSSSGGAPDTGFTAMVLGRAFFAKGLAFEIWLEGSQKSFSAFTQRYEGIYKEILATFVVGNGAQTAAQC